MNLCITGERALQSGEHDKLGFRGAASRVCVSLVDKTLKDGMVVGIEGAWGSGKSSLTNLIEEEIKKISDENITVIKFQPWLISERDALIGHLFSELNKALVDISQRCGGISQKKKEIAQKASETLRKFAGSVGKLGSAVEFLGDTGVVPAGKLISLLGKLSQQRAPEPHLSDIKAKLIEALEELNHRFIIIIDDIDRLEPKEVIEILRLARSVVDLPNIVYLLCYDSDILAHSIEEAAKVKDGHAYLEKIVQLTVTVPKPEEFQLRQWFAEELDKIAQLENRNDVDRLRDVISFEGGLYLKTPRSVMRVLDSVRFFWPVLKTEGYDLADLIWLLLIKEGNLTLYRWIEKYCSIATILSLNMGTVSDNEIEGMNEKLLQSDKDKHFKDQAYCYHFAEHLHGLDTNYTSEESSLKPFKLFQEVDQRKQSELIKNARLASPDHSRFYFAMMGPMHALTNDEMSDFFSAIDKNAAKTAEIILRLHNQILSGIIFGKADLLLDRLYSDFHEGLNENETRNLLIAFSEVMDKAYWIRPFDDMWVADSLWSRAQKLLPILLGKIVDEKLRNAIVSDMFANGDAISWLTTILRRETFAHGRYEDKSRRSEERFFSDELLDIIFEIMKKRYSSLKFEDLKNITSILDLLYAWQQIGDEEGPKNLVQSGISEDENLIFILEKMRSITSSSNGNYASLEKRDVSAFMDCEQIYNRLTKLCDDPALGERAIIVKKALDK